MTYHSEKMTMTAQDELRVLRERAKKPFWIQHEWLNARGDRKVVGSASMPTERQARKAFEIACAKPGTVHVFLFQHCISKTLILEQFCPNEMAVRAAA